MGIFINNKKKIFMVSKIRFTIVEDGKEMDGMLDYGDIEDQELEHLADILTGMHALTKGGYKGAKEMISKACKNLINSI